MPSFHELKAKSCPNPDSSESQLSPNLPNPNAYFGWQVVRAIQNPKKEIPHVGQDCVTPARILSQIRGEHIIFTNSQDNYSKLKAEREARKKEEKNIKTNRRISQK